MPRSLSYPLLCLAMVAAWNGTTVADTQETLPPVSAVKARSGESKATYQLIGTVMPRRSTTIGYAVPGRVKTLYAKRGSRLTAGDKIADLQTDVVKIEIEAAKAQLRLEEQRLAELEAGSRAEDIAEAKARMEAAAAIARRSKSQLGRLERLGKSRAASIDEIDVATAEADSSVQLLEAAKIAHQRLVAGPRPEQVAQAKAAVDLQREQVRLLEDRLKKHTLVAPFDGYVTNEFTQAGAWVTSGAPVIEFIELDTIEVEAAVPAAQIVDLRVGQSIRVECPARPEELLIGRLKRIVPAATTRARTFPVLLEIQNRIHDGVPILMSGMVVDIDLPVGPTTDAVFVPTDAVVLDGTKQTVFVVSDSGSVRRVPVSLGAAEGEWIAVSGELEADELVVVRGNERLTAGQTVEVTVADG